jgi:hypothetical protein
VHLAANTEEHLIQVPLVARLLSPPLQRVGEHPAEAQAPLSDALIGHGHAAGAQDGLDLAQAEAEAVVESDCVLDHLGRKAKAAVEIEGRRHAWNGAMALPDLPT